VVAPLTVFESSYARLRHHRRGWFAAGLTDAQVKVLEALLLRQPSDESATAVGLELLASDLDRSRGSVHRQMAKLTDAGWVLTAPARQGRLWRLAVLADSPDAAATARTGARTESAQSARPRGAQSARIVRARRDSLRDSLRDSARDDADAWTTPPPLEELRGRLRGQGSR
jgi:DNA-binding MarR family transcriptional regulator